MALAKQALGITDEQLRTLWLVDERLTHGRVHKSIMKHFKNRISKPPILTMYASDKDDSVSEYNYESSSAGGIEHDKRVRRAKQQH